jgi:hypothetical protein
MDYEPDILLIALVAHRRFAGSSETNLTRFMTDQFNRFDAHIRAVAAEAKRDVTPHDRSVIAAMAALMGGTGADAARDAFAAYVRLFAN